LITESSAKLRALIKARSPEAARYRDAFDTRVIHRLQEHAAEVVILAGYMLIISPRLCRAFLCLNLPQAVRLADHAAAYKLGGPGRESYPTKRIMDMIIDRLR
jgi:hypothetical protein